MLIFYTRAPISFANWPNTKVKWANLQSNCSLSDSHRKCLFFCFLKGKTLLLKELTVKNWVDWVYIYIYRKIDIAMMKATRGRSVSSVSFHLVLPQMIWLGQHWSQRHRMRGLLTLCIPLSWLQASLTQPSLTQRPPLQPQLSTPRWGTNRCVSFFPFLFKHPHLWILLD